MIQHPAELQTFADYVAIRRAEVDHALDRTLPCPPVCPPLVAEAMRYSLLAGGKRLRPLMTLAAAESVARAQGTADEASLAEVRALAMPAACAIEFIHTYSLVHDDLPAMDDDCMRRGQPSLHMEYGESLAILASDGLLAEAFALLANEPADRGRTDIAERKLRVIGTVGQAVGAGGMLGGQAIDLAFAGRISGRGHAAPVADAATLQDMHRRKTASLIRAAATAGAIMAGGSTAQVEAVGRFAVDVGLAFQIIDDILDEEGVSVELGKTAGKDRAAGKPTYPAVHGLAQSRALAHEHVGMAERALADAGIPDDRLMPIARWVLARRC